MIIIALLEVVLYCAIVVFIAFCILWVLKIAGYPPDENMMKWGRIIVMLLCLIAIIGFLISVSGLGGPGFYYPHIFLRQTY